MAATAAGLTTPAPFLCLSCTRSQAVHSGSGASQIGLWRSGLRGAFSLPRRGSTSAARLRRHVNGSRFVRAAQSSAKNEEGVADENLDTTKARLRELSESLVLPANYLERLPSDLRVDLKDAAFALSNGALNDECGEQAGELLMQLSRTWERGDTLGAGATAKQLPTLVDKLTSESSSAFVGRRCIRAGRFFTGTGQYEGGELQKIGKALIAVGEAFSRGKLPVTEAPISTAKALKFGDLQVGNHRTACLHWCCSILRLWLTSGLQNLSDSSLQYANDNALLLATSLRGSLLAAGYFCAILSACTTVGLLVLASTINGDKK